jgi:putative ABC transport system permease protein
LAEELFDRSNPLGELIRVSGERYRVIGVMTPRGQMLGVDLDDAVYVPAARAMVMFNHEWLMKIGLLFRKDAAPEGVVDEVRATLVGRHGSEDFGIATQDDMVLTLESILGIVTLTIGGLGGISLLVGGVGILTIMTISVSERSCETDVLRALGSRRNEIMALFLFEAVVLSALGGLAGLLTGIGGAWILSFAVPALPVHVSPFHAAFAVVLSILIGLIAGVAPARNAAMLDPVQALRTE